jgi:hypothetical protein
MESPAPTNVISLADRLEKRLMAAERSIHAPSLHHELAGLTLSEELHQVFKHLVGMAEASRSGKATQAFTAVAMWRIAEAVRDGAYGAERLERKLRKAKKRAKR